MKDSPKNTSYAMETPESENLVSEDLRRRKITHLAFGKRSGAERESPKTMGNSMSHCIKQQIPMLWCKLQAHKIISLGNIWCRAAIMDGNKTNCRRGRKMSRHSQVKQWTSQCLTSDNYLQALMGLSTYLAWIWIIHWDKTAPIEPEM